MSKKHKKVYRVLNYIEHLLIILISTVTRCISISSFAFISSISIFSFDIPVGIKRSAIGLKICVITAETKKYKLTIKGKKKKPDKILLLAKSKLKSI